MSRRVTMADIARESGVSKRTVSSVLNPREGDPVRVGGATRDRILAAAERMRYRPNRTARLFLERRHGAIGVLVHWIWDVPSVTLGFLLQQARELDYVLILDETPRTEDGVPRVVAEDCVDGLLLFGDRHVGWRDQPWSPRLAELPIPVIAVNTNDRTSPFSMTFDEEGACDTAVAAMAARGHRNLAVVLPDDQPHFSAWARRDGVVAAAAARSLPPPVELVVSKNGQQEQFFALLERQPRVDGVVLYGDYMAPDLYRAAAQSGRRIPEDLSVIGFNNSPAATALTPQVSSLSVSYADLGRQVVSLLADLIRDPASATGPWTVPYKLFERGSH